VFPEIAVEPITVEEPLQIETADPAFAAGSGLTVMVTVFVCEHPVAGFDSVNM
jgi:hypothetical protein